MPDPAVGSVGGYGDSVLCTWLCFYFIYVGGWKPPHPKDLFIGGWKSPHPVDYAYLTGEAVFNRLFLFIGG